MNRADRIPSAPPLTSCRHVVAHASLMRSETVSVGAAASTERKLVVVGASVRGFAASAARAGWTVFAADLFRDLDLIETAEAAVLMTGLDATASRGPIAACAAFPAAAWCYTGGLENHPAVIAAITADQQSARRPLFGSSPEAVRAVRDVDRLAAAIRRIGLCFPETRHRAAGVPPDGSFLVKPAGAAGGRGIRRWYGVDDQDRRPLPRHWQRFIAGRSWAASYVLGPPTPRLLGISRQFTGLPWCHAPMFAYCGSVDVPLTRIAPEVRTQLDRLGRTLADGFGLVGLVGVDLVVDAGRRLHVIEVNPRPTASMELHERATGESLAATHVAACGGPTAQRFEPPSTPSAWAKCVLFARSMVQVTPATVAAVAHSAGAWSDADGWPAVADIPAPPQLIAAGRPLITVFARGRMPAAALRRLARRTAAVDAVFGTFAAGPHPACQPASRLGDAAGASAPTL